MNATFTSIKDFKRIAYLPRLGKIRMGIKEVSLKTGNEYPKEVDYFVCPPEVTAIYGECPKKLDIMFPSDYPSVVIPFCYKKYGANQRLYCKGDGETAVYWDVEKKEIIEKKCPCEYLGKDCDKRGHLNVILPKVSSGGVYQIDTGSGTNINRILDAMDYWKSMVGRCKCILLTLERVAEKILNPEDNKMHTHYFLKFGCELKVDDLNIAIENTKKILSIDYKIESPKEDGEVDDTPIVYVDEENESALPRNGNGQQSTNKETEAEKPSMRQKIGNMLLEMTDGDKDEASIMLIEHTSFRDKEGKMIIGKDSLYDLTDKQVNVVYGKIKEVYKKWQSEKDLTEADLFRLEAQALFAELVDKYGIDPQVIKMQMKLQSIENFESADSEKLEEFIAYAKNLIQQKNELAKITRNNEISK